LTSAVLLGCAPTACRNVASGVEQHGRIDAAYDEAGRLTKLEYDSDRNGHPDMWAYMDGARLVRLEADENEDGKIDRWEYYPAAPGPGGLKQPPDRIERSTQHDGRVSRREFFESGLLVRVEEDTNGDGAVDKWERYSGGSLTRLELDTGARGKPDRRLIYRPDGSLERIEEDPTGSGEFRAVK
jgi:hypothetical protein